MNTMQWRLTFRTIILILTFVKCPSSHSRNKGKKCVFPRLCTMVSIADAKIIFFFEKRKIQKLTEIGFPEISRNYL